MIGAVVSGAPAATTTSTTLAAPLEQLLSMAEEGPDQGKGDATERVAEVPAGAGEGLALPLALFMPPLPPSEVLVPARDRRPTGPSSSEAVSEGRLRSSNRCLYTVDSSDISSSLRSRLPILETDGGPAVFLLPFCSASPAADVIVNGHSGLNNRPIFLQKSSRQGNQPRWNMGGSKWIDRRSEERLGLR